MKKYRGLIISIVIVAILLVLSVLPIIPVPKIYDKNYCGQDPNCPTCDVCYQYRAGNVNFWQYITKSYGEHDG